MRRLLETLYLYFGFLIFGLAMVAVFPGIGMASFLPAGRLKNTLRLWGMKFWASSFYTFGIFFYHKGSIRAQSSWPAGPLILVANHNSLLDTPALFLMLKRFALPLAKIELTRAPVFGHLCRWLTLPVDRKSPESRKKAMNDMNRHLSTGGSLLIFPEGKTNKSQNLLQPFEPGAFRLSKELGIPLIPIVIRNSRYCLAATSPMILRPGTVTTEAGPVFDPRDYPDAIRLQQAVYQWFSGKLLEKID